MKTPALVDVSVLLIFFNRPDTFAQVFEQVRKARPARLFLYQDGARNDGDLAGMEACRRIADGVDWDCELYKLYQEKNLGCNPSGYIAHKWAFSLTDKCIVLEDDVVPSVSFFAFCKEMLDRYERDERIGMIAGFNPEEESECDGDYLFNSNFSIWGWASWRRVVDKWDENYAFLWNPYALSCLNEIIRERKMRRDFLYRCRRHIETGKPHFETIFRAALLMNSYLAITPRVNMVNNVGVSADSTHFAGSVAMLPKGYRRIFTMGRHELEFPLRHPQFVIEDTRYRRSVYRIFAWGHPWIKIGRSFEELIISIRHGQLKHIVRSVRNRILKLAGRNRNV